VSNKQLGIMAIVGWSMFFFAMIAGSNMHFKISHQERMLEIKDSRIEIAHKSIDLLEENVISNNKRIIEMMGECKSGE